MLMLPSERLLNGALLYPDSDDAGRFYLHPPEPAVLRLDFNKTGEVPRWFSCDLELAAIDNDQLTQQQRAGVREILPVPWDVGVVKLWGTWGGRPRLISKGSNSGLMSQKSVHQGALDFDPHEIYVTAELHCQARVQATVSHLAWTRPVDEVFASLVTEANRIIDQAWRAREICTTGELFIQLVTEQERLGLLRIAVEGQAAQELHEQLRHQIARDLHMALLGDSSSLIDLITEQVVIQNSSRHLPPLPPVGQVTPYRILLKQRLGHIPGSCRYRVAPGFNWGDLLAVRVFADAEDRKSVERADLFPWRALVLTRSRSELVDDSPCSGNVWAEADHRDYPFPVLLPQPEQVDDLVILDAPPLQEDEVTIRFDADWPQALFPCEIEFLSAAGPLEPRNGRLTASSPQDTLHFRGLRWQGQDENKLQAHIGYSLQGGIHGYCTVTLAWGETNLVSASVIDRIALKVPEGSRDLRAVLEVAQGSERPMAAYQQFRLKGGEELTIYLDACSGPAWYRSAFIGSDDEEAFATQWQPLSGQQIDLVWPKRVDIKLSSAPDLTEPTRLWLSATSAAVAEAEQLELNPFGTKHPVLSSSDEEPEYYLALVLDEDGEPPTWASGRWVRETRKKLRVNQLYIDRLRACTTA